MEHYLTLLDKAVKQYWSLPAISNYKGKSYTYGGMAEGIKKYHLVFSECGIEKGDKIALYARNSAEWGIAYYAVVTYDAVVVPFLPDFTPSSVVELSIFSECKLMIADNIAYTSIKAGDGLIDALEAFKGFKGILNVEGRECFASFGKELSAASASADARFAKRYPAGLKPEQVDFRKSDMEAVAVISFTSGTTSDKSKGVVLPARSLSVNLDFAMREIPTKAGGAILSILPMAHMFGQTFDFLFPLSSGCHVTVLGGKPTPARLLPALAEVKPFMFLTVPLLVEKIFKSKVIPMMRKPALRVLLAIPGINRLLLNTIRKKLMATFGGELTVGLLIGGAALNKEVEDTMKKLKFPYSVGYGMTECGPLISYRDRNYFAKYSCGAPALPLEVRIDSSNPRRVLGEIQCKGDAVMLGYYKNPDATEASFTQDGWLKTGDMAIMDAKGNIFIKGRCKNMILTASGQNIYPEEIEDKVNNLPYIVESLIVGRGNALVALVVGDYDSAKNNGISEAELDKMVDANVKSLNAALPQYSQIAIVEMRKEPFEKTPKQSIRRFMYK